MAVEAGDRRDTDSSQAFELKAQPIHDGDFGPARAGRECGRGDRVRLHRHGALSVRSELRSTKQQRHERKSRNYLTFQYAVRDAVPALFRAHAQRHQARELPRARRLQRSPV